MEKQLGETAPYLKELLENLLSIISLLQTHQVNVFYEAVGWMVAAEGNPAVRKEWLQKTMQKPNEVWKHGMQLASTDVKAILQGSAGGRSVYIT